MKPYSILLMAFGQSNADVHDAGPRSLPSLADKDPVVAPNDGAGIRGLMGRGRTTPITGFIPAIAIEPKIQSLLAAAGTRLYRDRSEAGLARVIVRSEARGGRRFLGFCQNHRMIEGIFRNHDGALSDIFNNLNITIRECINVAAREEIPVRHIYIMWLHGESDRNLSRQDYGTLFTEFLDATEYALIDLQVPIDWLITQPSGTGTRGGGNHWPNRMAIFDVADQRDNVNVVAAGYGYPMCDGSHYSALGKIMLGEALGRVVGLREAGLLYRAPRLARATVKDNRVRLLFDTPAPLLIDRDSFPPPDPFDGFAAHDRRGSTLTNVTIIGPDTVELTLSKPPDVATLECSYAYTRNPAGSNPVKTDYPVGRGGLRTTAATASEFCPGKKIHEWVAGFIVAGKEILNET